MTATLRALTSRQGLTAEVMAVVLIVFVVTLVGCSSQPAAGTTDQRGQSGTTVSGLTSLPAGTAAGGSSSTATSPVESTTTSGTQPDTGEIEVRISDGGFEPAEVTIRAGDSVRWLNLDSVSRNVVADDGSFNSGMIAESQLFVRTFQTPGRYAYHCSFRPYTMTGVVIVK